MDSKDPQKVQMTEQNTEQTAVTLPAEDDLIELTLTLLANAKAPEITELPQSLQMNPQFQKLYSSIIDLRVLSEALNRGDLQTFVYGKGYILANLKALQSNLRHLTWQTTEVAKGNFSLKVDFLGDFSTAFNEMTAQLKEATTRLQRMVGLDPLTKIANRLTLNDFLATAFQQTCRLNEVLSVLLIDIDFFKKINDTYGHSVGDEVLIQTTRLLSSQFRASDCFARYGGEEFMAVLPRTDLQTAIKIAQRILEVVEQNVFHINELELKLTISIGVSVRKEEDTRAEDIVLRSDEALYEAKRSGRNCFRVL